ncbi:MAG: hypothetical protein OXC38_08175 [Gammaproteobacteria bacterium]|nr:hypothetical protein [Gammaproteobacteria bacterium]
MTHPKSDCRFGQESRSVETQTETNNPVAARIGMKNTEVHQNVLWRR